MDEFGNSTFTLAAVLAAIPALCVVYNGFKIGTGASGDNLFTLQ